MSTLNIKTDRQQEIVDITEQITQIVRGSGLVSPVHLAHQRRAHSSGSRAGGHCRHAGRIQPTDSGVRVQPTTIPARPCPHTQRDNRGVSRCADPLRNSGLWEFQKVVLIEFDGPKRRRLEVSLMPVAG